MTIAANITARQSAESIAELIADELKRLTEMHGSEAIAPFFATLRSVFGSSLEVVREPNPPEPMTDLQVAHFERQPMPERFKRFAGVQVQDVPEWYLDIICEPDEFMKNLLRWRHATVARRQPIGSGSNDEE